MLLSDGGNNRVRKVTGLGAAGNLGVGRGPCGPAACVLTPDFDWSKSSNTPKAGDTVTFTDKSLGSPTGWSWEFGDGATSNAQNPTHAYAAAGAYNVKLTITKSGSPTASTTKAVTVFPPCPSGTPIGSISGVTKYVGITPQRLLDTRCNAKVGPGGIVTVDIAGQLGVSPSAVGAVALNLTAVQPTAGTYLTVWPSGETQPYTSNLNVTAGQILPNMVIVKTGGDGKINIFNYAGQVDVIADVMGLFPTSTINPLTPFRLLDTRGNNGTPVGVPIGRVGSGGTVDIDVRGQGGVPTSGAGSVVLNVTAVGASQAGGFLTVYPGEATKPDASNLNFTQGETIANLVVVKLGAGASAGHVKFANAIGSIDLVVDVMGWFPDGASAAFQGMVPKRLMDTRSGIGVAPHVVQPGETITLTVAGGSTGVPPAPGTGAVVLNMTAADITGTSFVTVWPAGEAKPFASNLNLTAGDVVPNLVVSKVNSSGQISIFNNSATTALIADVMGYLPG